MWKASRGVGDSNFAKAGTPHPSLKPCIEHLLHSWFFPYINSQTLRTNLQIVIIPIYNEGTEALSRKELDQRLILAQKTTENTA